MCTLDTDIRKLFEEVTLLFNQAWPIDFLKTSVILRLLWESSDKLFSLEKYHEVVWFVAQDGFIEFMPNSSHLFLISLRDLSFQLYLGDEIFLVGSSDRYLQGYEFHKNCPFFQKKTASGQELAVCIHEVTAA